MKKLFLILSVVAVLFSGCKKEENNTTTATCSNSIKDGDETGVDCGGPCSVCGASAFRIKTLTRTYNGSSFAADMYTYDNQGRVTSIVFSGSSSGTASFTYGTNTVTEIFSDGNTNYFTLNSSGLAITSDFRDSAGTILSNTTYTYDSEGHLTSAGGTLYTWTDGNYAGSNLSSETYTYYTDKVNTLGNENFGLSFFGKDSENLVSAKNSIGGSVTYTYEFDSLNRVIKETKTGGSDWVSTFTYY